ncbi:MAG: hypothetical protein J3K34DRAFT_463961 [Monoraphidium minutum]|nr:MAG: hypothetical protein J3K34DRAFT_463961 [Monoraphidium minutum]
MGGAAQHHHCAAHDRSLAAELAAWQLPWLSLFWSLYGVDLLPVRYKNFARLPHYTMAIIKGTSASIATRGRTSVRARAAPHSMPSAPPAGAPLRPHQPLPAIVDGGGKSPEQIAAAMMEHLQAMQHQAIATGVEPVTYARVRPLLPGVKYHAGARVLMLKSEDGALQRLPGMVGLACGADAAPPAPGAAPAPAAPAEAARAADLTKLLLQHLGAFVIVKAGLRSGDAPGLAAAAPALAVCDVVIVIPGGDGGLPDAVARLVDAPVLAVPPGAPGGWAPARGAAPLAATAADEGVAAAVTAARILRMAATRAMQLQAAAAAAAGAGAPEGAAAL